MSFLLIQQTGIYILITIVVIFGIRLFFEIAINRIYIRYLRRREDKEHRLNKRIHTLINVENNLAITLGIVIILFIILNNFINITPLLASAGVLGLALSL